MARFLWPAVIVAVLGLPLVAALLERVPNIQDAEIVPDSAGWQALPVALGTTERADGTKVAQIGIHQKRPDQLVAHSALSLLLVTFETTPALIDGVISVEGTSCSYRTRSGASIVDNHPLAFYRGPGCGPPLSGTPTGRLDLTVRFRGRRDRVGLATYFATSVEPMWMSLSASIPGRPITVVRGRYVDDLDGPGRRRIELLGYVWHISDSSTWIWGSVGLALMLIFVGTVVVSPARASTSAVGRATGVGALGLGLALLYVVLVPPLEAPDEPDHVLAFAQVAGRPELADSLAALARRGHFERIHFGTVERFRTADVGHPFPIAWGPDVLAPSEAARSVTTLLWWKLLAPALEHLRASGSLLALRLANAVVFALCLGLATALLLSASGTQVVAPHAVCLALLLIPSLPFFSMHVSDFALLTSAYVVVAAVITALFLDGDRVHLLGLPIGLATSCILAGGRSALPFAATLAAAIAGRALLGSPNQDARGDTRRSLIFWIGLAIGLAMFPVLSTPEFIDGVFPGDAGWMPDWFRSAAELFRRHPSYVAIVIPIGLAFELGVTRIRRRILLGRLATGVVKVACALAAAAVLTSVLLSALVRYPALGFIEGATPPSSARAYASEVLRVAATGFRIGNHDWLLSAAFWEGFGWLDTMPGNGLVSLLVLLTALGLVALLVHIASTGHVRRAIWLGVLGAGWIVTLVLYAISSYYLHRNLHGRYLVGLYLSMLAVCGSVLALLPRAPRPDIWWLQGLSREWSVVAAAGAIHAYALRFILLRYF